MRVFTFLCMLFLGFGVAATTYAQSNFSFGPSTSITTDPAFPQPGSSLTATLRNSDSSAFGAVITWQYNDTPFPDATNEREVELTLDPTARTHTITATLRKTNNDVVTITRNIFPYHLDIILEPQTRVPDFYRGRALPSNGSIINATAIVSDQDGNLLPADLVYSWRVNNKVVGGGSLRGHQRVSFPTPMGEDFILTVDVSNLTGDTIARRTLKVPSVYPEVHFYEVDPLYGLQHTSLGQLFSFSKKTATVRAEPYYLDSRIFNDPDRIAFTVGNIKTTNDGRSNPYEVVIQNQVPGATTPLEFMVMETDVMYQDAEASMTIETN